MGNLKATITERRRKKDPGGCARNAQEVRRFESQTCSSLEVQQKNETPSSFEGGRAERQDSPQMIVLVRLGNPT